MPIEQKCDPVQCNRGLPRTRDPLYHQGFRLFVSNDPVLLLLNGGDDRFHLLIGGMAQLPLQNLVLYVSGAFQSVFHHPVLYFKLAFPCQSPFDPSGWRVIEGRPGFKIIKQTGNRGTPVIDQEVIFIFKGKFANIKGVLFRFVFPTKINSGKVRRFLQFHEPVTHLHGKCPRPIRLF